MATGGPRAAGPRRWIIAVVVAWLVILVGLGTWGVLHSTSTSREQTSVAEALPVVDRAAAQIASAATVDGLAVVSISDFVAQSPCKVSAVRRGGRYQRVVTALVQPGTEDALLGRVAARLPASYGASVGAGPPAVLSGDAGFFVGLAGSTAAPGVVRFVLDTGDCRAIGNLPATAGSPTPGERSPVEAVLARLGATAASWQRYQITCAGGGTLSTVEAFARTGASAPLDTTLGGPTGVTPVVAAADLYAYVMNGAQIGVRSLDHGVDVTATVACGQ